MMRQAEARGEYYVYVYIDPRNFEEFYYGKGIGGRKDAHLTDDSLSEKTSRIQDIKDEGQVPIIRVIATGLSESDAFLVEKTLLWKLGKNLLNKSSGSGGFAGKFRPDNTMHKELHGFDFDTGVFYFNIGHGEHRFWSDCKRLGFISAGGSTVWRDAIRGFKTGDIFAAYLKGRGFVGIGRIKVRAAPIRHVAIGGKPLLEHDLECRAMSRGIESDETCEHVAIVEWIRVVDAAEAKWKPKSDIYTTTHVRASLAGQPKTLSFLNEQFDVDLESLTGRRVARGMKEDGATGEAS